MLSLILATSIFAQDTIFFKNGSSTYLKVEEISSDQIKYRLTGPSDSVSYFTPRDSVFLIKYANGKIDSLGITNKEINNYFENADPEEMYKKGRRDALAYYNASGVFWGCCMASSPIPLLISPAAWPIAVVGSVTAFSITKPKKITLADRNLLNNPYYLKGYRKQARNKRIGHAFGGFALGIGLDFIIGAILFSSIRFGD